MAFAGLETWQTCQFEGFGQASRNEQLIKVTRGDATFIITVYARARDVDKWSRVPSRHLLRFDAAKLVPYAVIRTLHLAAQLLCVSVNSSVHRSYLGGGASCMSFH